MSVGSAASCRAACTVAQFAGELARSRPGLESSHVAQIGLFPERAKVDSAANHLARLREHAGGALAGLHASRVSSGQELTGC